MYKMRELLDKYLEVPTLMTAFAYHIYTHKQRESLNRQLGIPAFDACTNSIPPKSDTLFILGSGSSINKISDSQWRTIEQHDSIGVNFWVLHDFTPNILKFEIPKIPNNRVELFLDVLQNKYSEYKNSYLVCNNRSRDEKVLKLITESVQRGNIYYPNYITGPGYSSKSFSRSIQWIRLYNQRFKKSFLVFKRSSLSMILSMADLMGYSKIVLCGIDLENTDYFYDDPFYREKYPDAYSGQNIGVHITNDPAIHPLTMQTIISIFNDLVFQPTGKQLFTLSTDSALHPMLPIFS
jgi:hypothetical protein